jgi:hypothetical protein
MPIGAIFVSGYSAMSFTAGILTELLLGKHFIEAR